MSRNYVWFGQFSILNRLKICCAIMLGQEVEFAPVTKTTPVSLGHDQDGPYERLSDGTKRRLT